MAFRSAIVIALLFGSASAHALLNEWRFTVYLDDREIGSHSFKLLDSGDGRRTLLSDASFDVEILFINAYRYRHRHEEVWSADNCLLSIDSQTDDNGTRHAFTGERRDDGFYVTADGNTTALALPACVMTFSYWNPDMLKQSALINAQTGEYLDVDIATDGQATIDVRGQDVVTQRYRITAKDIDIEVYYSIKDNAWVQLESTTSDGYLIRYRLE